MSTNYEVIVVGAGAIGCSIGFHLAKAGLKVLILDRGQVGAGASNAASGTLAITEDISPYADLERESFKIFPRIASEIKELSGVDVELVECGGLDLLLSENDAQSAERNLISASQFSETRLLTPEEVHDLEPELTKELMGAMYRPDTRRVNNQRVAEGFARSAIRLGAVVELGANVLALNVSENRTSGVRLSSGDVKSDVVIVASGAWSNETLSLAGINLPMRPIRGQNLNLIPSKTSIKAVISESTGVLVPRNDGSVMAGVTIEDAGFENRVTVQGIRTIMNKATSMVPSLENSTLNWAIAGLRPYTEDDVPIMGPIPDVRGLIIASGHYRSGILLSPITGLLIKNLLVDDDIGPLSDFGLDRFSENPNV